MYHFVSQTVKTTSLPETSIDEPPTAVTTTTAEPRQMDVTTSRLLPGSDNDGNSNDDDERFPATTTEEQVGSRGAGEPKWVPVVASVAAAVAFICLLVLGGVGLQKYKRFRRNRVETISLENIIYDATQL